MCLSLIDEGLIVFGDFRFKLHEDYPDAPLSPNKIDIRGDKVSERVLDQIGLVLLEVPIRGVPDFCVGIPNAATAIAGKYSAYSGVPFSEPLYKDDTGEKRKVVPREGIVMPGKHVLLIDDVISMADSKFEAIRALESQGAVVGNILILVDREHGGVRELEAERYNIRSAMKLSQMLDFYLRIGRISEEVYINNQQRLQALNAFLQKKRLSG
ncbi:MAG: hypothetical protein HYU48_01695 [Candidatus Levybacteria bacterium]|nr:hypothetical protein [Candidatus Levybacteria bacterium]